VGRGDQPLGREYRVSTRYVTTLIDGKPVALSEKCVISRWVVSPLMTSLAPERIISEEVVVDAPVSEVWRAWTTGKGVRNFFAPKCRIKARPGGPYETYFDPDAPRGSRGGEGNIVLAVDHQRMLSFTWNAPPSLPEVRNHRTSVVVRFSPTKDGRTRVTLVHSGWGESGEWNAAYEYFSEAWGEVVLPRLKYRFAVGPVDWDDTEELEGWLAANVL
jgi:uncharacterized protein YndB with AHSA1/START domain